MTEHWVVVGAGSGGCVAAARLTEDSSHKVTLIEAGPDLREGSVPPAIDGSDFLAAAEEPGRTYVELSATRVAGTSARTYQRGRGVGGSSAINAMLALRGDERQYEQWGWTDTDAAWSAMQLPEEVADPAELGVVDRALLAASPAAEVVKLNRRNGKRVTSAEAYLWPLAGARNFSLRPDTAVDRVLFEDRKAIGVQLANGESVAADRVVIAAGAIHTPTILLRSAIANPGIGQGLQDHPSAPFTLSFRDGVDQLAEGLIAGTILQLGDLQVLPMNHLGRATPGMGLLLLALMRPSGITGSVTLASSDPAAEPVVNFGLLSDGRDLGVLRTGVALVRELLNEAAFDEIVEDVYIDGWGTKLEELGDDVQIDRWLLAVSGDYVHASSSCAMGRVVDDRGAVPGYEGIYVCDASVFPSIPWVNTHLPTTMLAERLTSMWRVDSSRSSSG